MAEKEHKCEDPNCKQNKKEQAEQKYVMLQLIDAQIKELEKEISALEQRAAEITSLKLSLKALAESKPNSKSFSPIGLGIYSESEIKNTKEVLVNVGADVLVKKTVTEAEEILAKQLSQLDNVTKQLTQNFTNLAGRAQDIEQDIQNLVK